MPPGTSPNERSIVLGAPGRAGDAGAGLLGAACGELRAVPRDDGPGSPKENANGVGNDGARSGTRCGARCGWGRAGATRGASGGTGIGGNRGTAIASGAGAGSGAGVTGGGEAGGAATGGAFASGGTGTAGASRASCETWGGGGGGGGGIAACGGTAGAGGTAGVVKPRGGDPGRNGCVSSKRGPDSGLGECPSNTIAMSAGGTSSASRGRRSIVTINRIRIPRCSASEAVSNGPSGRARRIGMAIGDRPVDPGGNRTNRDTPSVRTIPLAKLNNLRLIHRTPRAAIQRAVVCGRQDRGLRPEPRRGALPP